MNNVVLKVNNRTQESSIFIDEKQVENILGVRVTLQPGNQALLELMVKAARIDVEGEMEAFKATVCPDCDKPMRKATYMRCDDKLGACWTCECPPHESYPSLEDLCDE